MIDALPDCHTVSRPTLRGLADLYQQGSIGRDELNRRLGTLRWLKMVTHFLFRFEEPDAAFSFERNAASIDAKARLDGLSVIRISPDQTARDDAAGVCEYRAFPRVKQAFRSLKSLSLRARPIFHWYNERVRAHFFLCMPAYYLESRMRRKLKSLMFAEETPPRTEHPVTPARRSREVRRKQRTRRNRDGLPIHGFQVLLKRLGTLCATEIDTGNGFSLPLLTRLTPLQEKASSLLRLNHTPLRSRARWRQDPANLSTKQPPRIRGNLNSGCMLGSFLMHGRWQQPNWAGRSHGLLSAAIGLWAKLVLLVTSRGWVSELHLRPSPWREANRGTRGGFRPRGQYVQGAGQA